MWFWRAHAPRERAGEQHHAWKGESDAVRSDHYGCGSGDGEPDGRERRLCQWSI